MSATKEPCYGIIHTFMDNGDDEANYSFSYEAGTDPERAINDAIEEIKADKAMIDAIRREYGYVRMRDLFAECSDEPFNRRGITFLPVHCEYSLDGNEEIIEEGEDEQV